MWLEKGPPVQLAVNLWYHLSKHWLEKVYLNRILRISWSASLILVLYLSCIAIVAPVHPSGRLLILWKSFLCKSEILFEFIFVLGDYCQPEGPYA